nr:unnamed protein product [Callosobruchus analis]
MYKEEMMALFAYFVMCPGYGTIEKTNPVKWIYTALHTYSNGFTAPDYYGANTGQERRCLVVFYRSPKGNVLDAVGDLDQILPI